MFLSAKYAIQEKIGQGSFGAVYKATVRKTGDAVAIKFATANVFSPKGETKFATIATAPEETPEAAAEAAAETEELARETLKQEAAICHYLRYHAGIVDVKWFGCDPARGAYIIMSYYDLSLQDWMQSGAQVPLSAVDLPTGKAHTFVNNKTWVDFIQTLLNTLEYVHEREIIHRDIKPANIMLRAGAPATGAEPVLIDFGMSRRYTDEHGVHIPAGQTTGLIGSPMFASRHSHACHELSRRDDVESALYVAEYIRTGNRLPWRTSSSDVLGEKIRWCDARVAYIPALALGFYDKPDYCVTDRLFH